MLLLPYLAAATALFAGPALPVPLAAPENCLDRDAARGEKVLCKGTMILQALAEWERDHKPGDIFKGVGSDAILPGVQEVMGLLTGNKGSPKNQMLSTPGTAAKGKDGTGGATRASTRTGKAKVDPPGALNGPAATQVQTAADGKATSYVIDLSRNHK